MVAAAVILRQFEEMKHGRDEEADGADQADAQSLFRSSFSLHGKGRARVLGLSGSAY